LPVESLDTVNLLEIGLHLSVIEFAGGEGSIGSVSKTRKYSGFTLHDRPMTPGVVTYLLGIVIGKVYGTGI
jgi:hypothetical protein